MSTLKTMAECIEDGIRLLDEKRPGWLDDIDLSVFHIEDECGCVLGQNYGCYENGCEELGLKPYGSPLYTGTDSALYGFISTWVYEEAHPGIEVYKSPPLQEAWLRRLIQLKQERGLPK